MGFAFLLASPVRAQDKQNLAEGNCAIDAQREKKAVYVMPDSIKKTDTTISFIPPCESEVRVIKLCAVAKIYDERERKQYCEGQQPLRYDPYFVLEYYQ